MSRTAKKEGGGLTDDMQECHKCLKFVMGKPDAGPFLDPVDWKALNLPDYPEIVKHPMDLGSVEVRSRRLCMSPQLATSSWSRWVFCFVSGAELNMYVLE